MASLWLPDDCVRINPVKHVPLHRPRIPCPASYADTRNQNATQSNQPTQQHMRCNLTYAKTFFKQCKNRTMHCKNHTKPYKKPYTKLEKPYKKRQKTDKNQAKNCTLDQHQRRLQTRCVSPLSNRLSHNLSTCPRPLPYLPHGARLLSFSRTDLAAS